MEQPFISAILITKNEEENLPDCLRSIAFCSEIVVVDNGSTDDTVRIARTAGARVIETQDWPGFGVQKQRALDTATGDWVLSIDADERITPELAHEILDAVNKGAAGGFRIKRRSQFLGKWMRHGGWHPDRVLRLARRSSARFDPSPVHEKLLVEGIVADLEHPMLHFSYRDLADVLGKQAKYALAGAGRNRDAGKSGGIIAGCLRAAWTFIRIFILRLGFLDGRHGLLSAMAKSQETFWRYAGIEWAGNRSPK